MAIQRRANGGKKKNAGDLTPALAKQIVKAVRRTPLSLKSAAYACGLIVQDLRYIVKRGSLPGADPLWEDTSRQVRELIADAEARNFARLEAAAEGGTFEEVRTEEGRHEFDLQGVDAPALETLEPRVTRTVKLVPAAVRAQVEIQRLIEKDTWNVDPTPEDAPLVYSALFSQPDDLPAELQDALRLNAEVLIRWLNATMDPSLSGGEARRLESSPDVTTDGTAG